MAISQPHPPTNQRIHDTEIVRLIEQAKINSTASRSLMSNRGSVPLPGEIGLQVTNRCNLRCKHCFQWGDNGAYHALPKSLQQQELEPDLIEKVLVGTRDARSRLYIWGGEPLVYRHLPALFVALEKDPRWTVVCTNGIGVDRHIDAMASISEHVVMLISLDGLARQNDAMRTRGAFSKTVSAIRSLLDAKAQGVFRGVVSVAAVISDDLIDNLYDFAEFVEDLGVDTLHINFPWYISPKSACRMDEFYDVEFEWLKAEGLCTPSGLRSWHAYTYRLSDTRVADLQREIARLYSKVWDIRIKLQPAMQPESIRDFIAGSEEAPDGRTHCVSMATRLSILPNGKVTTCKLFPEFTVGDLRNQSLAQVWNGWRACKTRKILARGLTPVCSRCVQLYLNRPPEYQKNVCNV